MMKHFPLYLDISDKKILIIGGGRIAERRITTLLSFGPHLTLLSPTVSSSLHALIADRKLTWIEDSFSDSDFYAIRELFTKADMILAATNQRDVNHAIFQIAKKMGILVNVCDCPEECDFYFPAIIENKNIVASITANGHDHALVKKLASRIRLLIQDLDHD